MAAEISLMDVVEGEAKDVGTVPGPMSTVPVGNSSLYFLV